jgi:hypothetical protein
MGLETSLRSWTHSLRLHLVFSTDDEGNKTIREMYAVFIDPTCIECDANFTSDVQDSHASTTEKRGLKDQLEDFKIYFGEWKHAKVLFAVSAVWFLL